MTVPSTLETTYQVEQKIGEELVITSDKPSWLMPLKVGQTHHITIADKVELAIVHVKRATTFAWSERFARYVREVSDTFRVEVATISVEIPAFSRATPLRGTIDGSFKIEKVTIDGEGVCSEGRFIYHALRNSIEVIRY